MRHRLLDVGNHRAQIAPADATGHGHHALEVFPGNLRLAGNRLHRRHSSQREQMAVGRADRQLQQAAIRVAQTLGYPQPQAYHFRSADDVGGDHAVQHGVDRLADRIHIAAFLCCLGWIDMNQQRVAGRIDAIAHVDHTADLGNARGDVLCRAVQLFRGVSKDLDFDRLRHRSQVADQVFHQLGHFDLEAGHIAFDPAADIVHDRLHWPPVAAL